MTTIQEALALARQLHQAGNLAAASDLYRQILQADPSRAEAWHLIGLVAHQAGRHGPAIDLIRQAIALDSANPAYHSNLGVACMAAGRPEEAESCYREALRLCPNMAEAHNNLANVLKELGKLDEAVMQCREALRLQPDYAEAHNNLGAILRDQGEPEEASACYRQALHWKPDYASAHVNLGNLLKDLCLLDEAAVHYRQALDNQPDLAEAHYNLGHALMDQGHPREAAASYQKAQQLQPRRWFPISEDTLLPPVYHSITDMNERRQRFLDSIRRLREEGVVLDPSQLLPPSMFYLAYQGHDDRDVLRDIGRLYAVPPPETTAVAGALHSGRIKVGFLSGFFRDHAVGRVIKGFIDHLSRADFEVSVLSLGSYRDEMACFFRERADRFIEVPAHLPSARRLIGALALDILVYADIGMNPLTYALALSRLAPVQCVHPGHPVTTGLDTIDYFLSSALMETPDADRHYSETLVRFKNLPVYYYPPTVPAQLKGHDHFGLPEEAHLYGCFQTLYKFHPEFDPLLGEILQRDPRGQLLLIHGHYPAWDAILLERFTRTIPDAANRIHFLPRQPRSDFLNLIALCDVLLDPLHFSGGTTTYESFAVGTPVVTLPGELLRGRATLGAYQKMGVLDGVASSPRHYVDLAVALGTDPDYRAQARSKILAAKDTLYEDIEAVREMEAFFKEAMSRRHF